MTRAILLVPTSTGVGLPSVTMGVVRAFENQAINVGYYKPVDQRPEDIEEKILAQQLTSNSDNQYPPPLELNLVKQLLKSRSSNQLLEKIIAHYEIYAKNHDVMIVQGLIATQSNTYLTGLNHDIARALDAQVILVSIPLKHSLKILQDNLTITAQNYGGADPRQVLGCIINKVNAPLDENDNVRLDLASQEDAKIKKEWCDADFTHLPIFTENFRLLGLVNWNSNLVAPRVYDIAQHLNANIIHEGEIFTRRIKGITLCARSVNNAVANLNSNMLVITPCDRVDIILAVCLAALSGKRIAALLLTGRYPINPEVTELCQQAIDTGLPVLQVGSDSFRTCINLQSYDQMIPADDHERIDIVKNHIADKIDPEWIRSLATQTYQTRLSPPAFRYRLTETAKQTRQRIVLPEGDEERTIIAAATCAEQGIAHCILLGDEEKIHRIAVNHQLKLDDNIDIIDPASIIKRYVAPLVTLRKYKGMNELIAKQQLQENIVLATMMLQQGDVDGLVSGAEHTTANTIRPALQLIKTAPGFQLASSIFFMCLPTQVLIFGDCAINPDPSAEQLAEIALQSAHSSTAFGIEPKVAMISYSTGTSGSGQDVEKVIQATQLVRQRAPELLVDGPLQYDAAVNADVARTKAPNSQVAGQANVLIFPDLNTGNTTYKAVQRSAGAICIGPMLQGLNKPVNDLSRGALIEDIIYTIALTAIQAQHILAV